MDPVTGILVPLGLFAAKQTISFLYDQARECLKAWRANRDGGTTKPVMVTPPDSVQLGQVTPVTHVPQEQIDQLSEAKDKLEDFVHLPDPLAPETAAAAEAAAAQMRTLLEQALQTGITISRPAFSAGDIKVEGHRVAGSVTGVDGTSDANVQVGDINVYGDDVQQGGSVTGFRGNRQND
jgi:hypothetical protein